MTTTQEKNRELQELTRLRVQAISANKPRYVRFLDNCIKDTRKELQKIINLQKIISK